MKRILIVQIARMGDLIQTSALLPALAQRGAKVDLLVSEAFADTARALPDVSRVFTLSLAEAVKPLWNNPSSLLKSYRLIRGLIDDLARGEYDRVLNLTHTDYSAALTALLGGREARGMTLDAEGRKMVIGSWAQYYFNAYINRIYNPFNLVDIHAGMAEVRPARRLKFEVNEGARIRAAALLQASKIGDGLLLGIIPGASSPEKTWGVDNFAAAFKVLLKQMPLQAIAMGAKSEEVLGEALAEQSGAVNLCGQTDVLTLAAVLERCALVISNDTGPMHLAAAVGTPVIDVSLGSAYAAETAPWGEGHWTLEPIIDCYPCQPRRHCDHCTCHRLLEPEAVAHLASAFLSDREPDIGEPAWQRARVSRTGFDADGWGELKPVAGSEMPERVILRQAFRELWKRSLSGVPAWSDCGNAKASSVGRRLQGALLSSPNGSLTGVLKAMEGLSSTARQGARTAEELSAVDVNNTDSKTVWRLGMVLREVDERLIREAFRTPWTAPMVTQFTFEKDGLTGPDLKSLATQTAELYRQLEDRALALPKWALGMLGAAQQSPAGSGISLC